MSERTNPVASVGPLEVVAFLAELLMLGAQPHPFVAAVGLLTWLAFLVSLPADRGA